MVLSGFDAMNDALEMNNDLGFEFVPGFATHWAMGSETLITLGFPERVHEWAALYRTREHLPAPGPVEPIDGRDESSWRAAMGIFERAGDWQRLFAHELTERPWQDVVVQWWPRLMPGVAAGLTHGLLRTVHAVRSIEGLAEGATALQLGELAAGLAYWAGRYVEQPGTEVLDGGVGFPDVFATVPRLAAGSGISMRNKGLFVHMPEIDGWPEAVARLAAPTDVGAALSDLTAAFAGINLAHPDQFPVLLIHTVTAPAALRLMLPHLPEDLHVPSYVAMWRGNAALLATFGQQRPEELTTAQSFADRPTPSGPELVERAVELGDEHAVKLTEACLREHALQPDPRYLLAADQALGKLPSVYAARRRRASKA